MLADGQTLDRSFTVEPGGRWELDVDRRDAGEPARIILRWPVADREGATLEIDGKPREIAADSPGVEAEQIVIDVLPGNHAVRIVRPGFDDFRTRIGRCAVRGAGHGYVGRHRARPACTAELEKLRGGISGEVQAV